MIKLVMGWQLQVNDVFLEASHTSPVTLYLAELLSLFDQQADLLLPISLFNSTFTKGEVNIQHKYDII